MMSRNHFGNGESVSKGSQSRNIPDRYFAWFLRTWLFRIVPFRGDVREDVNRGSVSTYFGEYTVKYSFRASTSASQ